MIALATDDRGPEFINIYNYSTLLKSSVQQLDRGREAAFHVRTTSTATYHCRICFGTATSHFLTHVCHSPLFLNVHSPLLLPDSLGTIVEYPGRSAHKQCAAEARSQKGRCSAVFCYTTSGCEGFGLATSSLSAQQAPNEHGAIGERQTNNTMHDGHWQSGKILVAFHHLGTTYDMDSMCHLQLT